MDEALAQKITCSAPEHVLLSIDEASVITGLSKGRLYKLRSTKDEDGPPSFKVGGLIKYRLSEVLAWIKLQESTTKTGSIPIQRGVFSQRILTGTGARQ